VNNPVMPLRGEIWMADFEPIRGHEQGGTRPCLIVSVNPFNRSRAALVIGIPLTTRQRQIISHIPVMPPDGGLQQPSFIMCEQIRTLAQERLAQRWGAVSAHTMQSVEVQLRRIQGL
jgi:mRNA interferase MazF